MTRNRRNRSRTVTTRCNSTIPLRGDVLDENHETFLYNHEDEIFFMKVDIVKFRRSRYCVVQKFLRVGERSFARVKWLSVPNYPYAPCRLVVRVRELQPGEPSTNRIIIPIEKIDPCNVYVMPDEDRIHYYMMRDKGIDRVPIPLI